MTYEIFVAHENGQSYKLAEADNEDMIINLFLNYLFINNVIKIFEVTLYKNGIVKLKAVGDGKCVVVQLSGSDVPARLYYFNTENN